MVVQIGADHDAWFQIGKNIEEAKITYTYTGLTESGNATNEKALATMYRRDLKDWEAAIDHYLKTGKRLEHD